jgi:hypothetical protein
MKFQFSVTFPFHAAAENVRENHEKCKEINLRLHPMQQEKF